MTTKKYIQSIFQSLAPKSFFIYVLVVLPPLFVSSQTRASTKADSLKTALANTQDDTTKINLLNALGWELRHQNPDTSILLGKQALKLAASLPPSFFKEGVGGWSANSHSNLGVYYWLKGDYPLSLSHHFKALAIRKELRNLQGIAASLGNIGIVYKDQGDYPNALKHHTEALEIAKELGDKRTMAINLGNIGNVYSAQGDYPNALKHYTEALEIAKELGNKSGIAIWLGNIGSLFTKTGRFKDAEAYLDSALAIDIEIGRISGQMYGHEALSQLYDTTGRWQLADEHYKKYSTAKDSLFNEEKSKEIGRLEQKHAFKMAEIEREQAEKEKSRQEAAAVGRRNLLQYTVIVNSQNLSECRAMIEVR